MEEKFIDKESAKKLKMYIKDIVLKNNDMHYDRRDMPKLLRCIADIIDPSTIRVRLTRYAKWTFVGNPKWILTLSKIGIDDSLSEGTQLSFGELFPKRALIPNKREIEMKGYAILFYDTALAVQEIERVRRSSPQLHIKKDPISTLNEAVQRKKILMMKFEIMEDGAKLIISTTSGDSFEVYEEKGVDAKKKVALKALKRSILLKLPLEKTVVIKKIDPVTELNEIASVNKIIARYEYNEKTNKILLMLDRKGLVEIYEASGPEKEAKKKVATKALKTSKFLSYSIPQEKYMEKMAKRYGPVFLEEEEDEEKRLEAILEMSSYIPIQQHYSDAILRKIKRAQHIDKEEFVKMTEKELEKRTEEINKEIEKIVQTERPRSRFVYHKVPKKSPEKSKTSPKSQKEETEGEKIKIKLFEKEIEL